jgi:hypothetical protein
MQRTSKERNIAELTIIQVDKTIFQCIQEIISKMC